MQQLQLHEANEKVRTLEEIVHVLAQQQHDFERSMGQQRQSHYQSPLRLSASAHPTDSVASDSECEEFFDAFEDETEEQLEDLDAQSAELSNQSSSEQPIDQSDQSPELISDSRLR